MWRWVIRIYVAFVVFVFLMFLFVVLVIELGNLFGRSLHFNVRHIAHEHPLLVMFLIGMAAGQIYLGSSFTGRGWFRSKSGLTYEGFRLEMLKPWTWVIVSPVLLAGVLFWYSAQKEAGTLPQFDWQSFYRGFLMPDCSNRRILGVSGDMACSLNLMFLGTWVASIGYSLAPVFRKRVRKLFPTSATSLQGSMERRATKEQ